jgi:hypothetical protein
MVQFRTLDAGWGLEPRRSTIYAEGSAAFAPRNPQLGEVVPGAWGYTPVGGWPSLANDRLGVSEPGTYLLRTLDPATMT